MTLLTQEQIASATPLLAGTDQEYFALKDCPDCGGRGRFCRDPFALPYPRDWYVCPTCERAKQHYDKHGELPADVQAEIAARGSKP